jgi:leucyl/phenylalanyl-tRNA--protein transferase
MDASAPHSQWRFPPAGRAGPEGLVAVGADLEPATLVTAYRAGIFPMPVRRRLAWWSPDPRAILPLDQLRVSRSLHRAARRFEVRVDTAFAAVVSGCADRSRPGAWITDSVRAAYLRLHDLGFAHSVEAWSGGELAGGLYGVALGGLFAGESMFHRERDASKVALVGLVDLLSSPEGGPTAAAQAGRLLDVQWRTDHLASLGVVEVDRADYLRRLRRALTLPLPGAFSPPG